MLFRCKFGTSCRSASWTTCSCACWSRLIIVILVLISIIMIVFVVIVIVVTIVIVIMIITTTMIIKAGAEPIAMNSMHPKHGGRMLHDELTKFLNNWQGLKQQDPITLYD